MIKEVTVKSYTLLNDNGTWLGQVVLTSDGMYASVTDYGNFSYAWRRYGLNDFREFLINLNTQYFGDKMYTGLAYIVHTKKVDQACQRYAEMILPALQKVLREELATEGEQEKNTES